MRRGAQVWRDGEVRDLVVYVRRAGQAEPPVFRRDLGAGVVLRSVAAEDAPALFGLYERNRERFRPWLVWAVSVEGVADVCDGIAQWHERSCRTGSLTCVIEEGGRIRGMAYMVGVDRAHGRVELGYWLDAEATGRGLATRACRVLIGDAFERLGAHRLDLEVGVGIGPSRAVAERLGFAEEAVVRQGKKINGVRVDVVNYRLLRDDWRP